MCLGVRETEKVTPVSRPQKVWECELCYGVDPEILLSFMYYV